MKKYANNPVESDHSRLKSRLRPMLLAAIHGADDGAIDGAHDATAVIGAVAACSSTCRKQPSTPPVLQTGGQAVLPRRFRSSALRACGAGRLATGIPGQHAPHAARNIVTVTAPIGKSALGVIHSSSS